MRTIKAIFEIEEDSDITGVMFECEGKTIHWENLSRLEQIRMLNAWVAHYELFYKIYKGELIMKTLQNNFTTPEQSKLLLELGVPADSADMIIESGCDVRRTIPDWTVFSKWCCNSDGIINYEKVMPCWSVGRLIEIFDICNLYELHKFSTRNWKINIKELMRDYKVAAEENKLDFSKLEE